MKNLLQCGQLSQFLVSLLEEFIFLLFSEHPHRHSQQIVKFLYFFQLLECFICATKIVIVIKIDWYAGGGRQSALVFSDKMDDFLTHTI